MSSNIGLGALIQNLFADNTEAKRIYDSSLGKRITAITLEGDAEDGLRFEFEDGSKMRLFDAGRSCCESRYMEAKEDFGDFVGSKFVSAEIRDGGETEDGQYEYVLESQFLVINTSTGSFTIASYNSHNGYYGGICLTVGE